ncbi:MULTISPECIES: hypothetical protein [Actinosynnema]|uniref:hypothetical protein n=1 Tax=Actinosynnema TaxID=40566 RepID=UPI0020A424C3|nr:hypothetical protein [Actinosynnema pretiosum]MCP2092064.1 hypothetical protein [Actinosynnema pretiosum]
MVNPLLPAGHPLGVVRRVVVGAALTAVGMGAVVGVASAEPATSESAPLGGVAARSMTDQELRDELGRVFRNDPVRAREITREMEARGQHFLSAPSDTKGVGISGGVPIGPRSSVTGTAAYDRYKEEGFLSGGIRVGKPPGPQFTDIGPKRDGFNTDLSDSLDVLGAQYQSKLSLNISPDGKVTFSYKGTASVTTPDGRSREIGVTLERRADGSWHLNTPDSVTESTPVPGGGSVSTEKSADPLSPGKSPEVKAPAPQAPPSAPAPKTPDGASVPEVPRTAPKNDKGRWSDLGFGLSFDKTFKPAPEPPTTRQEVPELLERLREEGARKNQWRAENRPDLAHREALEHARNRAAAAEAAERDALPDRDHDGVPDAEDSTPNQNDRDLASADRGDGPESGAGYGSDRVVNPPPAQPPAGSGGDFDGDGKPDSLDPTWNQDDSDPTSAERGDGPETSPRSHGGWDLSRPDEPGETWGLEGEWRSGGSDGGGDSRDGAEGNAPEGAGGAGNGSGGAGNGSEGSGGADGLGGSGDSGSGAATGTGGRGSDGGSDSGGSGGLGGTSGGGLGGRDSDGDGLSGSADSTPNQNDTDPSSTDRGDGPEGGSGYSGSSGDRGSDSGFGGGGDSGSSNGSDSGSDSSGSDSSGSDSSGSGSSGSNGSSSGGSGSSGGSSSGGGSSSNDSSGSGSSGSSSSGSGSSNGSSSGGSSSGGSSGSGSGGSGSTGSSGDPSDADGDGRSGDNDSTPNQNDSDPSSTDRGDGPEGGSGYSGSTGGGAMS